MTTLTAIHVRHNADNGPLPAPLARVHPAHIVPLTGDDPRCGRCGKEPEDHVWQVVDPDEPEQAGVIDCATA